MEVTVEATTRRAERTEITSRCAQAVQASSRKIVPITEKKKKKK